MRRSRGSGWVARYAAVGVAVAAAMVGSIGVPAARGAAPAAQPGAASGAAPALIPAAMPWWPCQRVFWPWDDEQERAQESQKKVAEYQREMGFARNNSRFFGGGTSMLKCGTASWGFLHILDRHEQDWENLTYESMPPGRSWQSLADTGITAALLDPGHVVTYSEEQDTFCASSTISLFDLRTGEHKRAQHVQVILRPGDYDIVTAYPADGPCG